MRHPVTQRFFLWLCTATLYGCFVKVQGLYEDDIGKHDWYIENIGKVILAEYGRTADTNTYVYVATDEASRAIACLNTSNGAILWRRFLQEDDTVNAIDISANGLITVTGKHNRIIRLWDAKDGALLWDTRLKDDHIDQILTFKKTVIDTLCDTSPLLYVATHRAIQSVDRFTGRLSWRAELHDQQYTSVVSWQNSCQDQLLSAVFTRDSDETTHILQIAGSSGTILSTEVVSQRSLVLMKSKNGNLYRVFTSSDRFSLEIQRVNDEDEHSIVSIDALIPSISSKIDRLKSISSHFILVYLETGDRIACRLLSSLHLEALSVPPSVASIAVQEFPFPALFKISSKPNNIRIESFSDWNPMQYELMPHRAIEKAFVNCQTHCKMIVVLDDEVLFMADNSRKENQLETQWKREEALATVQKAFWIPKDHKKTDRSFTFSRMLVALSKSGKLFAMVPEEKSFVYTKFLGKDCDIFFHETSIVAVCSRQKSVTLLDIGTGAVVDVKEWDSNKEAFAVGFSDAFFSFSPSTLTVNPHVPPGKTIYVCRYDTEAHAFVGFRVRKSVAEKVWSIVLSKEDKIVDHSTAPQEMTHVSSEVATDNSVWMKYLNAHIFSVAFIAEHDDHRLTVLFIDAVSGRIIHRSQHFHASKPVQLTQSENYFVYAFWNTEKMETQCVSIALFEGVLGAYDLNLFQRPKWSETFSSYDSNVPIVLEKGFAFPMRIRTMAWTATRHGITPKFLVVGLDNGQIIQLPRDWLCPRTETDLQSDLYKRVLLLFSSPLALLTYNQSIPALHTILTVASDLESTTLIAAFGTDFFYTRDAPAKAFDLLPSNFNHEMLLALCVAFLIATFVSRFFAREKELRQAWK